MIVYRIDKQANDKIVARLRDMAPVLDEITPSLQILRKLLSDHETTLDSPAIKRYRAEMINNLTQAIGLTHTVAQQAQTLARASEQASKYLANVDDQLDASLHQAEAQPVTNNDQAQLNSQRQILRKIAA